MFTKVKFCVIAVLIVEFVLLTELLIIRLQLATFERASVTLNTNETFPEVDWNTTAGENMVISGGTRSMLTEKFLDWDMFEFLAILSSVQFTYQVWFPSLKLLTGKEISE